MNAEQRAAMDALRAEAKEDIDIFGIGQAIGDAILHRIEERPRTLVEQARTMGWLRSMPRERPGVVVEKPPTAYAGLESDEEGGWVPTIFVTEVYRFVQPLEYVSMTIKVGDRVA